MNKSIKNILQSVGTIAVVGAIIMWQTGYNPFKGSGEIGEITSGETLKALKKQKESDGKRLAIVGTFSVANIDLTVRMGNPNSLALVDTNGTMAGHFNLYNGKGKNEFFLPVSFTPNDLKIYDNAEQPHSYDEKIKVSFTLKRNKDAEPEKDPVTGEYSWEYDQIRIDPVN